MSRNYRTDAALVVDIGEALKDLRAAAEGMLARQRLADFGKIRTREVQGIPTRLERAR